VQFVAQQMSEEATAETLKTLKTKNVKAVSS
jgi:hypothetical protein